MYNNYNEYNTFIPFRGQYLHNRLDNHQKVSKLSLLQLNNLIRQLWHEYVAWTRLAIISIATDFPGIKYVVDRLLRNADDFGKLFANFYNKEITQEFTKLIRDHLAIGIDLASAVKKRDNDAIKNIDIKWHENADNIAIFLNSINPRWDKEQIRDIIYKNLVITKKAILSVFNNNYEESVTLFDEMEKQVLTLADHYLEGLSIQFPNIVIGR